MVRSYRCAICQRQVEYCGPLPSLYPFCSPRCRMVDLGRWLREQYSIDRDLTPGEWPDLPASPRADDLSAGSGGCR
jgi:hypothetical protein